MKTEELAVCPQCNGASLDCELCHGTGKVPWPVYWDYISMKPDELAICPQCSGSSLDCELCHGTGEVPWPVFWDYIDDLMEIEELTECGAVAV